jgi:hypothetical protein
MKLTPGSVEGEHLIMTGPIQGVVELEDGTVVDVSPAVIEAPPEQHEEIAHKIGLRYAAEGHPDDYEIDPDSGARVAKEFVYTPTGKYASKSSKKK